MNHEQGRLWLLTAIVCFSLTLIGAISIFATVAVGLNADYFEQAMQGQVAPLFQVETRWDYSWTAFYLLFFFGARFIVAIFALLLLRLSLIPPHYTLLHQALILIQAGMVATALLLMMAILYSQLYANDNNRAEYVGLVRVILFLYFQMAVLGVAMVVGGALQAKNLPRSLAWPILLGVIPVSFAMSFVGLYPSQPLVLGALPILITSAILGAYMLSVVLGSPPLEDKTLVTTPSR
jgi:MFS family permease